MIKRQILPPLLAHLQEKELTLLTGPRQVGKTYLMRLLQEDLTQSKLPNLYLNMDIENDRQFFSSQETLLSKIRLEIGPTGFVFLDEIQRKKDAGLFLKGLTDMNLPYKFIVSGSGSLELKEKIKESLAGRKKIFEIAPVNFWEFVNYQTAYKYESQLPDFFSLEKEKTQKLLEEYLLFGGYPRVILADTANKKNAEMQDIYESYLEKDIQGLLKLDKDVAFTHLVKILASQIGGLVNVFELSHTTSLSQKTVSKYLWYLEKTYILEKITPFYKNVRKEITKAPVYYFVDHGLRNFLLGLFSRPALPSELSGHLLENVVYNSLRSMVPAPFEFHFWRTRDNAEVDFVLQKGLEPIPIEIKYGALKKPEIGRSFRSFLNRYQPATAYYIHLGEKMETTVGKTKTTFLSFSSLPW